MSVGRSVGPSKRMEIEKPGVGRPVLGPANMDKTGKVREGNLTEAHKTGLKDIKT